MQNIIISLGILISIIFITIFGLFISDAIQSSSLNSVRDQRVQGVQNISIQKDSGEESFVERPDIASLLGDSAQELSELEDSETVIIKKLNDGSDRSKLSNQGDIISVDYEGVLTDGTMFDNSYDRGQPFSFTLGIGQVIQGWDQGMLGLAEGDQVLLFIPSDLAYGSSGAGALIPPNTDLVFFVEIVDIN